MCVSLCLCLCLCLCLSLCPRTQDLVNRGWTYNSELGWVLCDSIRSDGIDGSSTFYHYEWNSVSLPVSLSLPGLFYVCLSASLCSVVSADCVVQGPRTGCRKLVNTAGRQCRIHTYGDSFTHCDQVSDAETWQEYLAAHLQEPVENYGVGGYSVYQAYLRMRSVEATHPARYVVLNVWDDDSFRNIDAWRTIRFGSTYSSQLSSLAAARFCIVFLYWINC